MKGLSFMQSGMMILAKMARSNSKEVICYLANNLAVQNSYCWPAAGTRGGEVGKRGIHEMNS
jgi:hypothetical protein